MFIFTILLYSLIGYWLGTVLVSFTASLYSSFGKQPQPAKAPYYDPTPTARERELYKL